MANFICGPLYGLAFDYTRHTKLIILFSNLFEIGGQNSVVTYNIVNGSWHNLCVDQECHWYTLIMLFSLLHN